ncbi:unnamed protein product [Durusdinium trenchii]|uniref:Peptidase M50 domain-containing protein n=1 Tax=Durusdinium trenchii TaxID=1381693 RepID=A0ABP0RET1_9DINO
MNGLGGTGAQQSKDCSFAAGSVAGAPLRVSWFLVILFLSQLVDAINEHQLPLWVRITQVTVNELLLLFTVLCHEMGHGTMARRCGGTIAEVLLWPFGGICFTTRGPTQDPKQSLTNELYIVAAGPATHFPMSFAWVVLLGAYGAAVSHVVRPSSYLYLVPFGSPPPPCFNPGWEGCFHSYSGWLMYSFLARAIQLNVMLFLFNVFFPMYPMDGAKLIVCSLQLFCGASARCAAKVLLCTSIPLSVIFIGDALLSAMGRSFMGGRGGGLQPSIMAYMGIMCLSESYRIYRLFQEERLYTHPLFALARSDTTRVVDRHGATTRLNTSERDDPEAAAAPQVQFSEIRAFAGQGRSLGEVPSTAPYQNLGMPADSRAAWFHTGCRLKRMEDDQAQRNKTVRELEDERLVAKR